MYTSYFGLSKKPFSLTSDADFLYLSPPHKKALSILEYGLMSQAEFTVITGQIGLGKTTLLQRVLKTESDEYIVGLITNTHAAFGDLLSWVLAAFNIKDKGGSEAQRYQLLVDFLRHSYANQRRAVLIIDEAQNMDIATLEELRLLTNINSGSHILLQLVLVGHPELKDKLRDPRLIQFAQRISIEFHLKPLNFVETEKYINHRLEVVGGMGLFTSAACTVIYYFTGGVPRLINNICELCLVFTFADDEKQATLETVIQVVQENKTDGILPLVAQKNEENEKIRQLVLKSNGIDLEQL
ncbi:general secretion pathway protein [Methyloprofundus sedimenti]|uniref:General secretion pathway protein n=1 Tax=Methyloprofundus sedimenti TaxID=1420851 RepID=A0A1V8M6B0_9GAMM|nr:AAA family ATPase [Methyloprofundus sedimenti]OQK17026.1 general secretion pathway protein [Methyloprofundus sedimenti]